MVLDDLQKVIKKLRDRIERHRDDLRNSEFRTRILLIDPLLRELGWDVENPDLVALEDQPATSKRESADYILKNSGKNVAIVEAKNIDKKIDDLDHREQADNYARYAGVQFFVLTNGVTWLLYERTLTTSFELLEPIVRFDIIHDKPYHCALASISMWNPNLASGSPSKATEPVFVPPKSALDSPSSSPNEPKPSPDDPPKDSDLTPRRQLYLEYWTAHRKHLEQRNGVIKPVKPNKGHWIYFSPFHDAGFCLGASASVKYKWTRVRFIFKGKDAKPHFRLLRQGRVDIEKEIGAELDWAEKPDKKESDIKLTLPDADPQDGQDWDRQHQWLCEQLETFHKVFAPRIQALKKEETS